MLSKKADVDAVADALDLKANKASVASALHSKLSKDKAADRFSKMEAGIEAIHSQIAVLRSVSTSQPPPTIVKEITHAPDASRLQDMEAALSRLRSEMNGGCILRCFLSQVVTGTCFMGRRSKSLGPL